MVELMDGPLDTLATVIEKLCEPMALALSEQINQLVTFDAPGLSQRTVDSLLAESEPVLQTAFTLPALSADEAVLTLGEADALTLADFIAGGDGSAPPSEVSPDQLESLQTAMGGFVRGVAVAVGNLLDSSVIAGSEIATSLAPLSIPSALLEADAIIECAIPFHVGEALNGTLRVLMTPALAGALASGAGSNSGPAGLRDEPELNGESLGAPGLAADTFGRLGGFGDVHANGGSSPFQPFEPTGGFEASPRGIDLIMDIPLDVSVELGRVQMLIKDVLDLATGSIVELERVAGEPIDLLVNGQLIAKGEVVVIEDNFGIRITEIISPADRLTGVGKRG